MCRTRNGPRPRHPGSRTRFDLHVARTNVIVVIIITVVVVISGPFAHSPGDTCNATFENVAHILIRVRGTRVRDGRTLDPKQR